MAVTQEKYRVVFVAPASFFYQAPIFRELAAHPRIDLTVLFCSEEAFHGSDVQKKFLIDGNWGDNSETLEGYKYKFMRNYSPRPSYLRWPIGLMNFGLCREIQQIRPHAVTLMSWVNVTDFITIGSCIALRHPLFFMTDANIKAEENKARITSWIKKIFLGRMIFRLASGFLCSGEANKLLYRYYGVPDERLVPFAFSWESKHFLEEAARLAGQRNQLRTDLGISKESGVILYCGRLSPEKNPTELLQAFALVDSPHKLLAFVGDGVLRQSLENFVESNDIGPVRFFGFQNRTEISKFYAIADALVVPSLQEATGAVITEAMCFGLPVIVTDQVGFGMDLIKHGTNGFIYPVGDRELLANYITQAVWTSDENRAIAAKYSQERVAEWSKLDLAESLLAHLDDLYSKHGKPGR